MNRKEYLKPTMNIVKLQHTQMLATSDGVNAARSGYGEAQESTWGDDPAAVKEYKNPVDWND